MNGPALFNFTMIAELSLHYNNRESALTHFADKVIENGVSVMVAARNAGKSRIGV